MFPCVQSLRGIWTYFLANTLNHLLDCFPDLKIEREKQNSQHLRGMLVFLGLGAHPGVLWGVLATASKSVIFRVVTTSVSGKLLIGLSRFTSD